MNWELIPTPNPTEDTLRVWVDQGTALGLMGTYTARVTTLAEFALASAPVSEGLAAYVFAGKDGPDDEGRVAFDFIKPKTDEQRSTPIEPEAVITEDVEWLPVLHWIEFVQETGAPLSQNTVDGGGRQAMVIIPRWLVRRSYTHGQSLKTAVRVRRFLSDIPWPEDRVHSDQPMGTEVSWDLVGSHGSTGRCLHKEIKVPGQSGSYGVIDSDGEPSTAPSTAQSGGQLVPRTNHVRWQDFVVYEVEEVNHQWLLTEKTYFAPAMPKPSILKN